MTSGGNFVPTPAGAIQADRRAEAKQKAKQSGAAKARTDSLRERTNPGNAETNDNQRNPATSKTDGV